MPKESRVLSRERVEDIVSSIIEEESIKNAVIDIESGSAKGDGYMSFLTKVDIKGSKDLHLMIKAAPVMKELRKTFPIRDVFLKEMYFYDTIVKEFNKFEEERGNFEYSIRAPKCFKTIKEEDKELLVLENIKLKGYRLWNRKTQMNEDHINLVFKQYGKFHAVSYAMRDQNSELYESLVKDLKPVFTSDTLGSNIYKQFVDTAQKACSIFDPVSDKDIHNAVHNFIDNLDDFFLFLENAKGKTLVITHGDCWCNNMMFNYEDNSNPLSPSGVCMLDFQIVGHTSPVLDLCYFFLVSAPEEILFNYKHHLKIYYKSLQTHYERLGGNTNNLLSFEELMNDWKKYAKFGFVMALSVFKAMLVEEDEAIDLNDVKDVDQMMNIFTRKMKNDEVYEKMIKILAKYLYDNDMF